MKTNAKKVLSMLLVLLMVVGLVPAGVFADTYKSEYGITVMVGDAEMDLVADGTETCGVMQAQKLKVTVPAGTTEVTFKNITDTVMWGQMYVYNGAHNWEEFASNVKEATLSLAECGTSFCVSDSANNWYHVNITVAEPVPEEPTYKSEYGITVMVGDAEMDLVADGTETCGVMQAQKLKV
ncbi:MAG: hypothetical protein E7218_08475, partial [Anaerofustis stercorihominis]|nr:hypothetical protein [Anaerofustis stercorihominis]